MSIARIFVALALLLAAAGVVAAVLLAPWVMLPDEEPEAIDRRWEQIWRWATPRPETGGAPDKLYAAVDAYRRSGSDELVKAALRGEATITVAALDEAGREARAAFLAWDAEGGGLGPDPCLQDAEGRTTLMLFPALNLAQMALHTAATADDPGIAAALRLAAALRDRGGLLMGLAGHAIAHDAVQLAKQRGYAATPVFVRLAPRAEEVFGSVARDTLCIERMIEDVELPPDIGPVGRFIAGHAGISRERTMLRWFAGHRLEDGYPLRGDLTAFARAMALPDELPASHLVRMSSLDAGDPIAAVAPKIAEYQAFVARK